MSTQEKAAGMLVTSPTATDKSQSTASVPTAQKTGNHENQFATLRAQFALQGHRFERAYHGENKEPTYYAERWGMVRWLPTLHDAAMFLARLGGRL